ncbi:MAG: DUF4386 domain-containing protein [Gemmatimonadaceae bacterium]
MYLIIIALGLFNEVFVRQRLTVDDALTTAANIQAHELLWRISVATELVSLICVTVLMLTWLAVLRPVNRDLTWLAIFFALTAHAVEMVSLTDTVNTLFPLANTPYLRVFTVEQLAGLARLTIRAQSHAYGVGLLFSGCFFLIAGPLIFRSGYLPRLIGVLYTIAGVGYIVHTFVLILAPAMANRTLIIAGGPILIGEASLSLYLLIKGVDVAGWNRRQLQLAQAELH